MCVVICKYYTILNRGFEHPVFGILGRWPCVTEPTMVILRDHCTLVIIFQGTYCVASECRLKWILQKSKENFIQGLIRHTLLIRLVYEGGWKDNCGIRSVYSHCLLSEIAAFKDHQWLVVLPPHHLNLSMPWWTWRHSQFLFPNASLLYLLWLFSCRRSFILLPSSLQCHETI